MLKYTKTPRAVARSRGRVVAQALTSLFSGVGLGFVLEFATQVQEGMAGARLMRRSRVRVCCFCAAAVA